MVQKTPLDVLSKQRLTPILNTYVVRSDEDASIGNTKRCSLLGSLPRTNVTENVLAWANKLISVGLLLYWYSTVNLKAAMEKGISHLTRALF